MTRYGTNVRNQCQVLADGILKGAAMGPSGHISGAGAGAFCMRKGPCPLNLRWEKLRAGAWVPSPGLSLAIPAGREESPQPSYPPSIPPQHL